MLKRCIMIFPQFSNGHIIDKIREKYDPLASHVRPHITLVFPFESDIKTEDLKAHIKTALLDLAPFEITLNGITPTNNFGKYLFLDIQYGSTEIIELHKRLYTGILESYYPIWLKGKAFLPHMTIENFDDDEKFEIAIKETRNINDSFKTIVNEVSVEIIDENEDSNIELVIPLN